MKKIRNKIGIAAAALLLIFWIGNIQAQDYYGEDYYSEPEGEDGFGNGSSSHLAHEAGMEYSYTMKSDVSQGERNWGKMDAQHIGAKYVFSFSAGDIFIPRFGMNWQRFSFGVPGGSPLPNTLQSVAAVIGTDIELSDTWIMRLEMEPGIYSDWKGISIDDFNIPVVLGASYLVDKDLQWFFGISGNPRRSFMPVFPAIGVRWKFADQWTLFFLMPDPQIQYEVLPELVLHVGASIRGGNFQLSKKQHRTTGRVDLNNDNLEYREIRAGAGATWEFHPGWKLQAEGGWSLDQRFESAQSSLILDSDGAPYGQFGISAAF